MAIRKSVTNLQITGSLGGAVISAPPAPGTQAERSVLGAFGDTVMTNFVATPREVKDVTVLVIDENGVAPLAGTLAEFTFTTTYSDGATPVTRTATFKAYIQDVEPESVEVDGNRRAAWSITLTPQGGEASGS